MKDVFGGIHGTTKVGERGQIVIPKKLREKLKLKKGDDFVVMEKHGSIVLVPTNMMNDFISQITDQLKKVKTN